MGKLSGQVALVTGGSRGIGRGIALGFAREGADVAINYRRNREAAMATAAAIEGLGRRAAVWPADVADWPAVEAMVEQVIEHFGHLDIAVANSGVASRPQAVWDVDIDHWRRVIDVDLHGVFHTCKAVVRHMIDRKRGSILLISSVGADLCAPFGSPYYVAKAGVNALTRCLAQECAGAGVRVNCIAPGLIKTDMGDRLLDVMGEGLIESIPLKRPGYPEDVAHAAVFLASDDAGFITGKVLRVDGGQV
jgi:NAD(P)-dependent dehydrogenase (short-subunit alcohol dehydrogenase family)